MCKEKPRVTCIPGIVLACRKSPRTFEMDMSDSGSDAEYAQEPLMHGRSRRRLHFDVTSLQQYYHLPLKTAAKHLGICEAALKRICRRNHIHKWPFRRLQSIGRQIDELKHGDPDKMIAKMSARGDFLLPHELETNRKNRHGVLPAVSRKIRELEEERALIVQSAHVQGHQERGREDLRTSLHEGRNVCDGRMGKHVSQDGAIINAESPLHVLASLCSDALAPVRTHAARSHGPGQDEIDTSSVRILCLLMNET